MPWLQAPARRGVLALLFLVCCSETGRAGAATHAKIDFNRDIRPLFSDTCFACHGPDDNTRKSGLRLDQLENAFKAAKSGAVPVVPGSVAKSELLRRVTSTDSDERMPPAKTGRALTPAQIDLLKRWVEQGAEYRTHWAFVPPSRPELPPVKGQAWPKNGIDRFILARLEKEGLRPSREADRASLIRRATLDLTGLPPTPGEVDAFLADPGSHAYEKVVDRLLASPSYGERMALEWLDAARYADTHGYHIDSARDMTHWRDGVIEAFNRNQRFDQFTIEQLAGDLLPQATDAQKIASGFNRNHMINYEGGAIAAEYHSAYLVDRVNTTATVWLGLTMACAQCHDHKYDPITMEDYYRFYAFFNNVPENGLDGSKGNAVPVLKVASAGDSARKKELETAVAAAEAGLKQVEDALPAAQDKWEQSILAQPADGREPPGLQLRFTLDETLDGRDASGSTVQGTVPADAKIKWVAGPLGQALELDGKDPSFVRAGESLSLERTNAFSYGGWVRQSSSGTGALLAKMDDDAALRGFDLLLGDGKLHLHLISAWPASALRVASKNPIPKDTWTHVFATYDGSSKAAGVKLYASGQEIPFEVTNDSLTGSIVNSVPLNLGKRSRTHPFRGAIDDVRVYHRALAAQEVAALAEAPIIAVARMAKGERTATQSAQLAEFFRNTQSAGYAQAKTAVARAQKAREDLMKALPSTMIMGELAKPRDTFILVRGQYDQKGNTVTPGTPVAFPPLPKGAPANRLGLARWLVAPEQPLTARVTVNRYWQMYFGDGLVRSAENFGSQADWPTHPDLLDWLATEFIRTGWDVKALQKLILTSATYRQSSSVSKALLERDPQNHLLARGARLRMPAEFIRDQALAVSGLLNRKIGGASVFPYQPAGLWEELMAREDNDNFTAQKYRQSKGPDLYRRSMYTFWKRTSSPSTLGTLDAPDRQTCVVKRQRTNTPLQALLLLNDPTFVESARKLAERLMLEAKGDKPRITLAYRLALSRPPKPAEMKELLDLHQSELAHYRQNPEAVARFLKVGESGTDPGLDPAELAAWTIVASTILNLDETITKG